MTRPGVSAESARRHRQICQTAVQDCQDGQHEARVLMDNPHLLLAATPNGDFDEF